MTHEHSEPFDAGKMLFGITTISDPDSIEILVWESPDDWNSLLSVGQALKQLTEVGKWGLGALLARVETKYGEGSIEKMARDVGISAQWARELRHTYKVFREISSREENLSFSHHRIAAHTDNPTYWLDRAASEGWVVRHLENAIAKEKGNGAMEEPPAADAAPVGSGNDGHVETHLIAVEMSFDSITTESEAVRHIEALCSYLRRCGLMTRRVKGVLRAAIETD